MKVAIRTKALGKRYRINGRIARHNTLRDLIANRFQSATRLRANSRQPRTSESTEVWALRDVSFEVTPGDIVGVLGRNGAGKSTLLKVLARITEPTYGSAEIVGRVGSLLEVGTGFHPELTGRENIYLSSAILGMRRAEIAQRFDEIVEFAEVTRFIDTPVKHYSSGMYLRLAFAVAAHLEPEILLVDEVLAVGDAAFQRKCLGKMSQVSHEGRTVLFVSHNMSAITELCRKGVLMRGGRATMYDSAMEAVTHYLAEMNGGLVERQPPHGSLVPGSLRVHGPSGRAVHSGDGFVVEVPVRARQLENPSMFLIMEDAAGRIVIHNSVRARDFGAHTLDGDLTLQVEVPPLWLAPGLYTLYFKFLVQSTKLGEGRVKSERFMLHITGELDRTGRALLSPRLAWQARPSQCGACAATDSAMDGKKG